MMGDEGVHIRLKLDTDRPIALGDFVGSFVGLGNQFEKFVASHNPELKADSEFFVKEVRAGCIEADLVAFLGIGPAGGLFITAINAIDKAQILTDFVASVRNRLTALFKTNGRLPDATKGDVADFGKTVSAIARDPDASATLEAAIYEDGERKVRISFQFSSKEARQAERALADQRAEMDATVDSDHSRVLLRFVRPSVEQAKPGKPGGERGIIESLHPKALAVLYASDLAEQRMKHELRMAEGNVFKKYFDIDVNVERNSNARPIAYRVTDLHAVIDEPDEE